MRNTQRLFGVFTLVVSLQLAATLPAYAAERIRVTNANLSQFSVIRGSYVCSSVETDPTLGTISSRTLRAGTRWYPLSATIRRKARLAAADPNTLTTAESTTLSRMSSRTKQSYQTVQQYINRCEGDRGVNPTPTTTPTPRSTPSRTQTARATSTATAVRTPTALPTSTPIAARTPTQAPSTPTPTPTAVATSTPVRTATPTATATPTPSGAVVANAWSNPATWGGSVPSAGASVTIPAGKTVILDQDTPALGGLTINGELVFADKALNLTAQWILVHGTLRIGSENNRFSKKATITLTATNVNESVMGMGTRGLFVMGGKLLLHGKVPTVSWTKLAASAAQGATNLSLLANAGWNVGDNVVVAPTTFYRTSSTHRTSLAGVSGNNIQLSNPLPAARWGQLQYVTSNGMSLTQASFTPPASPFPTSLDERAEVGNLSRSIVIQGPDDDLWRTQGFGAHVMIMDKASTVAVDGVEFHRIGQAGQNGRYPFHWHALSYNPTTGAVLGDATGHFIRNSTIWESKNRCITIHATNGALVDNNICYDIKGHAIFIEDGNERRNVITNNLVLGVRNPESGKMLLKHDDQSSGFWITNPDNTIVGNVAADSRSFGFWLSFADEIFGLTKNVQMRPSRVKLDLFEDNVAHSNGESGLMLDFSRIDEAGNLYPNIYQPTSDEKENVFTNAVGFVLSRITTYKNQGQGFWNRGFRPKYYEWVNADNEGKFFAGGGGQGLISRSLVVGRSLNNSDQPREAPVAFATYHSEFDIQKNVIVNFPFVSGKQSGAFATDDYYITPVEKGMVRNVENVLIKSDVGWRQPPVTSENWTLAGALWDPFGYVGAKNNYWVYNQPFFTSGATCTAVAPAGENGMSCNGEYYGVGGFKTDFDDADYNFRSPIEATRYNSSFQEIGKWSVGDGLQAPKLNNMRHFAGRKDGIYGLKFPGRSIPRWASMSISNAYRASDSFILGVSLNGSVNPKVTLYTQGNDYDNGTNTSYQRQMTSVSNFAAVQSSNGGAFWFDRSNNMIWMKIVGGLEVNQYGDANYNWMTLYIR